ncbi:hypothetical protein [Shewanella sp. OMA3-2]|uniref:hypothetical protein n=1 Tax=Shewanella sp. OMA3-2 TaxID=2908650 RepID=UPI001F1F0C0B|nr:hypothetical protein [Shewanella sp. OMA3-2]UJF23408.1 hypothetical protein L0B17_08950 [Shewanella sp. OMA3-2]
MNALVEYEANQLMALFGQRDELGMHMFMEHMHIPVDVQDRLINEISILCQLDQHSVGELIEHHGQSLMSERLLR